jgi:hypothetical protein
MSKLQRVYQNLKNLADQRYDEDGTNSELLYSDIIAALKAEKITDLEIIESIKDCLIAHAFVGVSVMGMVGGPRRMEIPVGETKDLAEALYYLLQVKSMLDPTPNNQFNFVADKFNPTYGGVEITEDKGDQTP